MRYLVIALVAVIFINACQIFLPETDATATARTCVVMDDIGLVWRRSARYNACGMALRACYHAKRFIPNPDEAACYIRFSY